MDVTIHNDEWPLLSVIPELDLVEMAVDLDILVPAQVDERALLETCIAALLERARQEGLPFSKYDREDLEALPPPHLQALGELIGLRGRVTVRSVLKRGQKIYRWYQRERPHNASALLLPTLLPVLARIAHEQG